MARRRMSPAMGPGWRYPLTATCHQLPTAPIKVDAVNSPATTLPTMTQIERWRRPCRELDNAVVGVLLLESVRSDAIRANKHHHEIL